VSADTKPLLDGRYRVERRLGSGGMAAVYLAEDERLSRPVALKRLHGDAGEEVARRFRQEAKLGAALNHPGIVSIYDTVVDDEGAFIVMEYIDGPTLARVLADGPMRPDRALHVIETLGSALDHAHARGIVHRDVKPANVLIGAHDEVKLLDLGIATALDETRVTMEGVIVGTPAYMAPEQLAGERAGPPADIYALAALAFEMFSGRRAWPGDAPLEIAERIRGEDPPDLRSAWSGAPESAARLLCRGLAREPASRPATAGALAADLKAAFERHRPADRGLPRPAAAPATPPAASARPAPAAPPRVQHPAASPSRKPLGRLMPVALLAVVVLAAGVAIGLLGGLGSGGEGEGSGNGRDRAERERPREATERATPGSAGSQPSPPPSAAGPGTVPPPADGAGDPARGTALNNEGKALIDSGDPAAAVPVLEQAVSMFPAGSTDINRAYALFNLGNALRLSGRPDEAIPVLEERLEIPDQTATVRAELRAARQAAEAQ
jgi:serine/threonine-protein kinase